MNILFIVIDTLRADHLGCYGYPKPTSPRIDHLAGEGVLFERCYAPGIPTTPAHTTMYTGLHPLTHNIVCHGGSADLERRIPVLPELLQRIGYTTCAVDNLIDIKPWLARGYEFYINPSHRHRMRLLVSCEEINARAIPWLKAHAREKFFLFVHYWEPHTPYLPPERYRLFWKGGDPCDPRVRTLEPIKQTPFWEMWGDIWFRKLGPITDLDYIVSLYDGEIRHVDEGVGTLLDALDDTGVADDTLVLLTADHGEIMYRNGIFFDHHGLYEENIRVPLILRWPARLSAGRRIASFVQHLDFAPTLLRWAQAIPPESMEGKDFGLLASGEEDTPLWERLVCCESTWQSKWAVRTATHKFILARAPDPYGMPPRELYDLSTDPGETTNLADTHPTLVQELESWLEEWIAAGLRRTGRTVDPLVAQGITLGKRWEKWQEGRHLP
ncbi:MAG TPA: sulfatase [Chthonomonadales bacterium]|nr:sulfatase [Chthonomonadales bacterium]